MGLNQPLVYHGCTEFWTNDERLHRAAGGIAVNLLDGLK
jgi:hypothetical protein